MGLTKRKDGWYVEFPVIDDRKVMTLARGTPGSKVKRWKTGTNNKTMAKQQEAIIKTDLMKGVIKSDQVQNAITFKKLSEKYLSAHEVKKQATYEWKISTIQKKLVPFFGNKIVTSITLPMIESFRELRRQDPGYLGSNLKPATINRNLALLKNIFSFAVRQGWIEKNPSPVSNLIKKIMCGIGSLNQTSLIVFNTIQPLIYKLSTFWPIKQA